MRNVRKAPDNFKIVQPSKKGVKRLKPNNSIGNSLMRKLEPILALPQKPAKFKFPYKSPQIAKKANGIQQPKSSNYDKENPVKPLQPEPDSSTNITNKLFITATETGEKLGEGVLNEVLTRNEKAIATKMSSVKIQPIDPYKFCEPLLKDCGKNSITRKDVLFKKSQEEQSRVNQEVLAIIKKTSEAIQDIRSQHEKWKNSQR